MTDTPSEPRLPPSLRLLKALVFVLMITMIVGVITVVAVLVTRMPNANAITEPRALPESIVLPENTTAQAVTLGKDWIGVVSSANQFLLYDRNGTLLQTIELQLPK